MHKERWYTSDAIIIHMWALTAEERQRSQDPKKRCSLSPSNLTKGLTIWQLEEMATSVGVSRSLMSDKNKVQEQVRIAFEQGQLIALRRLPVASTSGSGTGATREEDGHLQLHGTVSTSGTKPELWYGPFPVKITGKENEEEFVLLTWMQVFALEREEAQKILTDVKARVIGTFKITAKDLSAKLKRVSISDQLYEKMLALRSGKDVETLRKEAAEREQRFNKRFKPEQETIRKTVDGEFKRRTNRPYPGAKASLEDQLLRRFIQDEILQKEEAGPHKREMPVKIGFIAHKDGANIRTTPAELPGSRCLTAAPLPPGTRVVVIGTHPRSPEWSYATVSIGDHILHGYVQGFRITTDLPEPAAVLYRIKPKDKLEPIAARIYHQAIQPGRDLRFYENVILYVNQQTGRVGVRRVKGDVQLVAGHCIWLVSVAFANQLQEIVPSGSITGGAFAMARMAAQHLEDIIASVRMSPDFFPKVAGKYWDAIRKNVPEIVGCVIVFIAAEALSSALAAATGPTAGISLLGAALIQLVLAYYGAKGVVEAGSAALKHAEEWITHAWAANGNVERLGEASQAFCQMVLEIILVALGMLGMRSNVNTGMKLMDGVKFTRPSLAIAQIAGGGGTAVVFNSGITATAAASSPIKPLTGLAAGITRNARGNPVEEPITSKQLDDVQAEKLLEKLPNWERIKQFVGQRIPEPRAPEFAALKKELEAAGYQLDVLSEGAQPFRLRRPSGKAQGDELAALTVSNEGRIMIQVGNTNRLSVYSRCRKNYLEWLEKTVGKDGKAAKAAAETRIAQGNQLHHLTPDEIVQRHPLTKEALERVEGYTIDRGSNVLDMPSATNEAGEIMHLGSHPKYSKFVESKLDEALQEVSRGGKLSLPNISAGAIDKVLSRVESELRKAIETGKLPKEVLKELIEDGIIVGKKLALLEIRREGEVLFA